MEYLFQFLLLNSICTTTLS